MRPIDFFPEYKCHKIVRAGKITGVNGNILTFDELETAVLLEMDDQWMEKHKPEVGGYLVSYSDDYVSYSPAKAFEEGYALKE